MDLIQSNVKDEVKIPKDSAIVKDIIKSVFIPLSEKIATKVEEEEINTWYVNSNRTYYIDNYGKKDISEFNNALNENDDPREIQFNYYFEGFKKAGTDAFTNSIRFSILFSKFKYMIKFNYDDKNIQEFLYSHDISGVELNGFAEELVACLMDDVLNAVERLNGIK